MNRGYYLAHQAALVAQDRLLAGVLPHQPDVAVGGTEGLGPGLVLDECRHDLTVVRRVLPTETTAWATARATG